MLSPFLFLLVVDFVMRKAIIGPSLAKKRTEETQLTDIDFADDTSLLAETRESLQELTTNLETEAKKVVLNQFSEN